MLANPAHSVTVLVNVGRHPADLPASLAIHRREQLALFATGLKLFQLRSFVIGETGLGTIELADMAVKIASDPLQLWSDKDLAATILTPQTSVLVIGGCWLEEDVVLAAVEAVALGYDVRVLADISLARHKTNRAVAFDRFAQHGILLTTVRQMLLEWTSVLGDPVTKHRIRLLVS